MSYYRFASMRENPETSNAGMKWTKEEDDELMKCVYEQMSYDDISKHHKRSVGAIKCRVMKNALDFMEEKELSLEQVAENLHISLGDLQNYKDLEDAKLSKKKSKETSKQSQIANNSKEISPNDFMKVLMEIRDYLKIIAEGEEIN